jgi:hypothetical protein
MPTTTQETTRRTEAVARLERDLDAAREATKASYRREAEIDLALREAMGKDDTHTRWMRAYLADDEAGMTAARVEGAAEAFIRWGWAPPPDLDADAVTAAVMRLQTKADTELLGDLGCEVRAEERNVA